MMITVSSILKVFYLSSIICSSAAFLVAGSRSIKHAAQDSSSIRATQRAPFGLDDPTDDRLVDIRTALNWMNTLLQQENGAMQDFQTRIQKVVSCGESSIPGAGQGLFAKKNVKKGTVIGFYPAHGMGAEFDDGSSICCGMTPEDQEHFDASSQDLLQSNYIQFLIGSRHLGTADFGENTQLFVDVNPNRNEDNDCWNGHYVNDGATVTENSEQGMLEYYTASRRSKNCVHVPFGPSPLLAVVTTRKVKKGEEFFTTYGCLYWLDAILKADEDVVISEAVQLRAKETAQDLYTAMTSASAMFASQQDELKESFV